MSVRSQVSHTAKFGISPPFNLPLNQPLSMPLNLTMSVKPENDRVNYLSLSPNIPYPPHYRLKSLRSHTHLKYVVDTANPQLSGPNVTLPPLHSVRAPFVNLLPVKLDTSVQPTNSHSTPQISMSLSWSLTLALNPEAAECSSIKTYTI